LAEPAVLDAALVDRLVRGALEEDIGPGDVTTEATVPADARARGKLLVKQDLLLAGLPVALAAFRALDPEISWDGSQTDGQRVTRGSVIGVLEGRARPMLGAERVALNFLQRLSGVATLTRRFVDQVAGTGVRIRDTRKTTPLLRGLEKHAVELGGGTPHRAGLASAILVKDNHVRLAGSVGEATRRAAAAAGGRTVEVEVERPDQIEEALAAGAQMILLDNFHPQGVHEAVRLVAGRAPVEVSGGVTLMNVRAFAEAGPSYIAIGALTHSAPAVDVSLEIEACS
jgi:nicotinate-nucleotide pyrophosphorylase (carboxylating)